MYVMESFLIGDALPDEEDDVNGEEEDSASEKADASKPKKQKFGTNWTGGNELVDGNDVAKEENRALL
jgi:hypothetical protein